MAASGDELRRAMRRFPSGVCVVTVDDEGAPFGTTVGSLVSLALEPALVGISIGHQSSIHLPLRHAGRFAVSVLGGDQAHVAQHFARARAAARAVGRDRAARRATGPSRSSATRSPGSRCTVASEHEAGDHTVFVGAVERIELGRAREALVYLEGAVPRPVIAAVVFDLDGVLIQTEEIWDDVREAFAASAALATTPRRSGR